MDPLTIGLVAGGVSAISRLFGAQSEAAERKRRFHTVLKSIEEDRLTDLRETGQLLNSGLLSRLSMAKQSGTRKALALGRMNEASSFTAPIENRASTEFAGALERSTFNINERARRQKRAAQMEFAGGPIEPGPFDVFGDIAEGASNYFVNKSMRDIALQTTTGNNGGNYRPDVQAIMGGSGKKKKTRPDFSGFYD